MTYACTEDRFLDDVKDHSIKTIRDDGVHRHISFTNGDSSVYRFDLITWPGHLCICGDCGTYVFRRLDDMFSFFRMDKSFLERCPDKRVSINPGYWGEKLESVSNNGGYEEYDEECFIARVGNHFNQYWEDSDDNKGKSKCWDAIKSEVLYYSDNENDAYTAVNDFSHGYFRFEDFFDGGSTERYTFRYIWCLYAIAYGVKFYDDLKDAKQKLASQ